MERLNLKGEAHKMNGMIARMDLIFDEIFAQKHAPSATAETIVELRSAFNDFRVQWDTIRRQLTAEDGKR